MPEIKQIESGKLLCLETKGSLLQAGEAFGRIEDFLKMKNVSLKGERMVIIYDQPDVINREQAHFAAARELAGDCMGDGEMTVVTQGIMTVACENHQGSWEGLKEAYQRLLSWIHDKGYELAGSPREFYLVGPPADATAYVTEIQIPVRWPRAEDPSGA
ncbi:GyrI-like domain-containing protein [candidate division FCPU426 bacterium]|nr:GyrI-like domain-containing protein [candidate division FCPU426 bacterium]